jgi:hypothetical protein
MRKAMRLLATLLALTALAALAAGQQMISAKSGMIHYVEGKVLLDNKAVEPKLGVFPQMNNESLLRTEQGRAEVLLAPGVFLRLGESSGVRMISNKLTDTRLELLGGSALIECAELRKETPILVVFRDAKIWLRNDGLYRLNSDPPELRVYDGEAGVEQGRQPLTVKKGRVLALDGTLALAKFDTKLGDSLHRWARRRAEYLAMANVSSARSIWQGRQPWRTGGWLWNPYFGMFTYLPYRGVYRSFWGYQFWSPREVYVVFQPPQMASGGGAFDASRTYNPSLGYHTMGQTSAGTSGVVASSPAPTAASSSSNANMPRESSQAGGRGR